MTLFIYLQIKTTKPKRQFFESPFVNKENLKFANHLMGHRRIERLNMTDR